MTYDEVNDILKNKTDDKVLQETIDNLENIQFLHIPSTVKKLENSAVSNYYAFDGKEEGAEKEMTVEFSDSITEMDKYAFLYTNGSLKFEITAKRLYAASQRVL